MIKIPIHLCMTQPTVSMFWPNENPDETIRYIHKCVLFSKFYALKMTPFLHFANSMNILETGALEMASMKQGVPQGQSNLFSRADSRLAPPANERRRYKVTPAGRKPRISPDQVWWGQLAWLPLRLCKETVKESTPGYRFTNGFSIAIQIRWTFCFILTSILIQWSLQNFAHRTTAVLSWHVQKFIAISWSATEWQQGEICIEFEIRAKIINETGPRHDVKKPYIMYIFIVACLTLVPVTLS